MIEQSLPRLTGPDNLQPWTRQLIDDLNVRLRALTRARVTQADAQYGYLQEKIVAGANITITVLNPGGNEQLSIASTGGGGGTHNLLDAATHLDTVTQGVTRGSLIKGNATPAWDEFLIGTGFLKGDGTDASWATLTDADIPNTITLDNITQITTRNYADLQNRSHVLATNTALGADHTISGTTAGQVLRASSASAANFQALAFSDLTGSLAHSALSGLTAGDDHSQYVYRSGRAGANNDFTMSTSQDGRIIGTSAGTFGLVLRANNTASQQGFIDLIDRTRVMADTSAFPNPLGSPFNIIDIMPIAFTTAIGDAFNLFAVRFAPTLTVSANPSGISLFYAAPELDTPLNTNRGMGDAIVVNSNFTYLPVGTGIITNVRHRAVVHNPQFIDGGTAGNVIGRCVGVETSGFLDLDWTATDWCIARLIDPTGSGAITRIGGMMIEDIAAHGSASRYTVWSKGANAFLAHGGPGIFGASQSTITAPAASTVLELSGTTTALLLTRATAAGIVTPANGHLFYDTGTNKLTARENGAWVAFQPLDTDLTEIAGVANVRGDVLITDSTPSWVRLAIGSANTCFRSDGTDPAWSTGILDNNARVAVSKNSAATTGTRRRINLIEGSNITLTVADDGGSEEVDVTIAASGGGSGATIATDLVTGSTSTIPNGSDLTCNTVTTTPGTVEVLFEFSITYDKSASTNKSITIKFFKDGSEVDTTDRYTDFNDAGSAAASSRVVHCHWVIASESAGSHTYTVRATENQGGANLARRLVSRLSVIS